MENKGMSCTPLYDSVYFEGYVIDLHNNVITHVDFNSTKSCLIVDMLFGDEKV